MDYKNATLEEQLLAAIFNDELFLKFEMGNDKIIEMHPRSAYDLDKEIVEIHGSATVNHLKGITKRSMEKSQDENKNSDSKEEKNTKSKKAGKKTKIIIIGAVVVVIIAGCLVYIFKFRGKK